MFHVLCLKLVPVGLVIMETIAHLLLERPIVMGGAAGCILTILKCYLERLILVTRPATSHVPGTWWVYNRADSRIESLVVQPSRASRKQLACSKSTVLLHPSTRISPVNPPQQQREDARGCTSFTTLFIRMDVQYSPHTYQARHSPAPQVDLHAEEYSSPSLQALCCTVPHLLPLTASSAPRKI